jgi:hypothetical protein
MNCLVQGVYGAVEIWRIKKKIEKKRDFNESA